MMWEDGARWRIFMEEPARYAVPAALRRGFHGELTEHTCARLQAMERLHPRLSVLMLTGLPEAVEADAVPEADRRIALLDAEELETVALRAGAVLCANGLAGTIAGPHATAIHEALGRETIMIALANRALSDAGQPETDLSGIDDIRAYVLARGMAVLSGLNSRLPDAVRARIALKLPALAETEPADDADHSGIIAKVAS